MKLKKILQKSDIWLTIIIVLGILLVVNFFSYQLFFRLDLTQNKDYSISKVSKNVANNLDDLINIKVYFSDDLPSQYITLKQEVDDILDEYANYSDSKIKIDFIDPNSLENTDQEMYMLGVPALQFNVLEKDKYQVVKGYLGIVVQYGDEKEVIPVVENTRNLEYQITTAIKKVISDEMATIGFLASNGSLSVDTEITAAYQKIQELYDTELVDLTNQDSVSDSVDTLIVVGSRELFSDDQLKAIDEFLMKGKSIMFLLDRVGLAEGLSANLNDVGITNLLDSYGIKVQDNLVLDYSSGMASFNSGFFTFTTDYPFWPKITKDGFDQENVVVSKLESLVLPWVSSVELDNDILGEDNQVSVLAKSTNKAWEQTGSFDLNPQQNFNPSNNIGEKNLAVSVFGKFNSKYSEKSTDSGRVVVVGDAGFIEDSFLRQNPANILFFQNIVDSLSLDDDLISIRSKGVSERPIKELTEGQKLFIKFANIFGVTIVVVLFGLIRYFMRRRSKFVDEI